MLSFFSTHIREKTIIPAQIAKNPTANTNIKALTIYSTITPPHLRSIYVSISVIIYTNITTRMIIPVHPNQSKIIITAEASPKTSPINTAATTIITTVLIAAVIIKSHILPYHSEDKDNKD
ncbi:hypothetical protein HWC53_gp165 [Bacillus phage vB_BmeM-Goe8]|uniref:Uncharacterized protein n=1 Tax=Bacillus phage vB_BmeM-Goe8 TaxID=2593638 RepID=A0A516KMV6_9CAUD|nr:hypothetical protein HWC53_gp165 [Bacillus phage vB_BmeM-Goe8]QDP42924.1 hypothetical protein Goe8_c01510 [Bacillus phage vB_BmeM-Goe8]